MGLVWACGSWAGGHLTAAGETEGTSGKDWSQDTPASLNMKNPGLLSFRLSNSVICRPHQILGRECWLSRGKRASIRLRLSLRKHRASRSWKTQTAVFLTSEKQGLPPSADTFINSTVQRTTLEEMCKEHNACLFK